MEQQVFKLDHILVKLVQHESHWHHTVSLVLTAGTAIWHLCCFPPPLLYSEAEATGGVQA